MFRAAVHPEASRPTSAAITRRAGARLIDAVVAVLLGLVLTVVVIVGTFTFGDDLGLTNDTLATLGDVVLYLVVLCVLIGPFVVAFLVALAAAVGGRHAGIHPGRRAFGLRVVDADDGEPARGRAALHGLLRHLPTALVFLGVLEVGFDGDPVLPLAVTGAVLLVLDIGAVVVRGDRRALHDILAGVTVTRSRPRPAPRTAPGARRAAPRGA